MPGGSAQAASKIIRQGTPDVELSIGSHAVIKGDVAEYAKRKYANRIKRRCMELRRIRREGYKRLIIIAFFYTILSTWAVFRGEAGMLVFCNVLASVSTIIVLWNIYKAVRRMPRMKQATALPVVEKGRQKKPQRQRRRLPRLSADGRRLLSCMVMLVGLALCGVLGVNGWQDDGVGPRVLIALAGLGSLVIAYSVWPAES